MVLPQSLLPFTDFQLDGMQVSTAAIVVQLSTTCSSVPCPLCGHPSVRVHSHYPRTVADLPWAGIQVRVHLTVRKFFCLHRPCSRQIFAEPLAPVVARYARHTHRLEQALQELVLQVGGQPGARVAATQGLPTSPRSLLRLAHAARLPPALPPRVIGVDDWAWRKGRRYGTIIVDLERHRPIALLADRTAETLAAWLAHQPQIEVISRDRAGAYAEGATSGCPTAMQVADRFHLVKNLVEALEKVFLRKPTVLKSSAPLAMPPAEVVTPGTGQPQPKRPLPVEEPTPRTAAAEAACQARQAHIIERYVRVQDLHAKKVDVANIARQLGLSRRTVYRYLEMPEPPPRRRLYQPRTHLLDPYKPYLLQRWNEGCRSAQQLWREVRTQGYAESNSTVRRFVARLRADSGQARKFKKAAAAPLYDPTSPPSPRPLTARQAARLVVARAAERLEWQAAYLERLTAADGELEQTQQLVDGFMRMVRTRQGADFDEWLAAAEGSAIQELHSFAQGLRKDYAAVAAGLTLEWSNGQTEAQVGRVKMLKRTMYGRAGLALLRQRVLYRPPEIKRQAAGRRARVPTPAA